MPKPTKDEECLTIECPCQADEMVLKVVSVKGFRQFYCATCKSNTWLSPKGFKEADRNNKVMER
jgi:hypothetical protein